MVIRFCRTDALFGGGFRPRDAGRREKEETVPSIADPCTGRTEDLDISECSAGSSWKRILTVDVGPIGLNLSPKDEAVPLLLDSHNGAEKSAVKADIPVKSGAVLDVLIRPAPSELRAQVKPGPIVGALYRCDRRQVLSIGGAAGHEGQHRDNIEESPLDHGLCYRDDT